MNRIFISYSHRGKGPEWKSALLRALHVFEQQRLLDVWQDGKIRISAFWDDDIKEAMASARLAVVLLTREALESEFILKTEFPILRERQQRDKLPIFPVVCEDCNWRDHDWLRATQSPNESNPLSQLSEPARNRIFRELATNIANELSRVALADHSAIPAPDSAPREARLYLDKFPLTRATGQREEKLIGREQELALLDLAFTQPQIAIVSLVAWGGVGKTMLVQHWLRHLQRGGWHGARLVYAWSFYSQGTKEDRQASEDTFLAHALEWFGVQCEPTLSPWEKGRLLAEAVARERTLLILDGIEPLQYPPGPMGGQLRAPGVQSLLKQLARKAAASINSQPSTINNSLCLVTTREPLADLAKFQCREGSAWGSVLRVDLGNLTDEAGAALLHHAGAKQAGAAEIKADDTELLAASREVDGHALTLNLLGRFLARAHGGDIRRRDLVKFGEADRKEQGGTTFKMLAAFETWFAKSGEFGARQLAVLRMLGLFERPASFDLFDELCRPPVLVGLNEPLLPLVLENWNLTISFLSDFDLVAILSADSAEGYEQKCLSSHPLIREYFARRLAQQYPAVWCSAHHRLFEYLKMSTPDKAQPKLSNLLPLYEAVAHACKAGEGERALTEVFINRIQKGVDPFHGFYSMKQLGAFNTDLSAMACFFDDDWSKFTHPLSAELQGFVLNQTALYLRALGRIKEALSPMQKSSQLFSQQADWQNASRAANNLCQFKQIAGDISGAIVDGEKAIEFAQMSGEGFISIAFRSSLADTLHQAGEFNRSKDIFQDAENLQARWQPQFRLLHSVQGYRYCDFLLTGPESNAWRSYLELDSKNADQLVSSLAECGDVSKRGEVLLSWESEGRLLDIALDHLAIGRAALYQVILEFSPVSLSPKFQTIQKHVTMAAEGLRSAGTAHHIPRGLLTCAWLRFIESDTNGARADLDEAWDIAERGPMRLHLADIHLYRARLFFREKTYPWKSPQDDLVAAKKLINECGYHRRDEELADAKRAILGV